MDEDNLQTSYTQSGFNAYLQRPVFEETPTTEPEANEINFDNTSVSGSLSGVLQVGGSDIASETETAPAPEVNMVEVGKAVWPIGSIFMAVVATNPRQLLGFGIWDAFGKGKVIVGVDDTDSTFSVAESTGGAKTHTLTAAQMPYHNHGVTDPGHNHGFSGSNTETVTDARGAEWSEIVDTNAGTTQTKTTGVSIQYAGSGQSHNNLQPYITAYLWKRVK